MKYLKCKCGIYSYFSEVQLNCPGCGRFVNLNDIQKSIDILRETGLFLPSVLKDFTMSNNKYDMNRWITSANKKDRKSKRFAS
jgi:hypothetical protein